MRRRSCWTLAIIVAAVVGYIATAMPTGAELGILIERSLAAVRSTPPVRIGTGGRYAREKREEAEWQGRADAAAR